MSKGWKIYHICFVVWCTGWALWALSNIVQLSLGVHSANKLGDGFLASMWLLHLTALVLQTGCGVFMFKRLLRK